MHLNSLSDHQLAVLFTELTVLLVAARLLGAGARRIGQPAVVGELLAGLVLGPSVFGRVWPAGFAWFLPTTPAGSSELLTVAQVSLVVLLVVIGAETDLRLIGHLGRAAASVSIVSLAVPLAAGGALAVMLPRSLAGRHGGSPFVLLIAGAVAVSSLPVIAKIVGDLGMARRNFGQLIYAAGAVNDTAGFVLVAVATALASTSSGSALIHLGRVVAALVVLAVAAATIGQWFVDRRLRGVLAESPTLTRGLTVTLIGAFGLTMVFQVVGVEGALGAFVLGVLLGRSRFRHGSTLDAVQAMSAAIFAPLYFATAGLRVDVGALSATPVLISFAALVGVAAAAKFVGAVAGGALARLPRQELLALGFGLNGRGALQVIIGSAGLSAGIFTPGAYTDVILMSVLTSVAAAPLMRWAVRDWAGTSEEQERLGMEEELDRNVVVRAERILIPSRGSANSIAAAEVVAAAWPEAAEATVLTIGDGADVTTAADVLAPRAVELRHVSSADVLDEIVAEAKLGYGVIALGAAEEPGPDGILSPVVDDLLVRSPVPMVIVRRARNLTTALPGAFATAVVPVTGSSSSRAGQEVAYNLSRHLGTEVVLVHVVTRPGPDRTSRRGRPATGAGHQVLTEAASHASDMGVGVRAVNRHGPFAGAEVVAAASDCEADVVVMGATVRQVDDRPFLGHTVEYVLENAECTVVVVAVPERAATPETEAATAQAG